MEIRPPDSVAEFRAALAVNRAAWRDAYADILPAAVLSDLGMPASEELRERYAAATGEGRAFLVAVGEADGGVIDERAADEPNDEAGDDWADANDGSTTGENEAEVVGFATVVWDPEATKAFVGDDDAGLRAIYVHPDRQGEGVGTRLLAAADDRVPADCERLVLEAFAANDPARAFYEARGFDPVGESAFAVAGESYPTAVYARER